MVGSLLFIYSRTRPYIRAAVNILCRECARPHQQNLVAAKQVLRYLRGTNDFALELQCETEILTAFSDADWGNDRNDRKSVSGYFVQLGHSTIYWKCIKQICVAVSTMEAEYVPVSEATKAVLWLRSLLQDLGADTSAPTPILEDNAGVIT